MPVGGDPDDGLVEFDVAGGAVEVGVAIREHPAVGGDQPVALSVCGGGDPDDGLVEFDVGGGAVEVGVTERVDLTVGGDEPVARRWTGRRPCPPWVG